MTIRARSAAKTAWCARGHVVAWEQFALPVENAVIKPRKPRTGEATLKESLNRVTVTCVANGLQVVVNKKAGRLAEVRLDDRPVIIEGPALNAWRGPLSNDGVKGKPEQWHAEWKPLGLWCNAGIDKLKPGKPATQVKQKRDGSVIITIAQRWETRGAVKGAERGKAITHGITHRHTYTINPDGSLAGRNTFDIDDTLPDLPRIGVMFQLAPGFEDLAWFGRGPGESYADRKVGMPIGLYRQTVTEQYVPYILPQEHGNKVDVRWFELASPDAGRLKITGPKHLSFSASHFTPADLTAAYHTPDLTPRDETIVCLDAMQRGLGTKSCGPDTLDHYKVHPGRYRLDYTLALRR